MIMDTATSLTTEVWQHIVDEATQASAAEPVLAEYLHNNILNHGDMAAALSFHLASKLSSDSTPASMLREIMTGILCRPEIIEAAAKDIQATGGS
jgi:serine O-acetyltransferase